MKSICEVAVKGKRVLVRADLDVPIRRSAVEDDFRIRACLPTLKYLVKEGAKIIICGHLDRPGGKIVEELRMDPVAEVLAELCSGTPLACPEEKAPQGGAATEHFGTIHKVDHIVDSVVGNVVSEMGKGDVLLLENLRFEPGEEANDLEFTKSLASLADIYVNECFATSHRNHASIIGVPKLLPAYAGLRLEEEVKRLSKVQEKPRRPLIFIIGGAKTETKVPLVRAISEYADKILLGGKLMFEKSLEDIPNVVFPVDAVDVYDIGPKTIEMFKDVLGGAGTVVWGGPLGKFEDAKYARGTRRIAEFLVGVSVRRGGACPASTSIVGGGDTLAVLKKFGLRDKMGFVSTGGGAMLSVLAGEVLPGIEALG